ncbi:DUF6644 family protein [Pseudomonas duriflava]|uniref:DUF6644 family protein n=1 Tax=Pseudomonas duriflava TaxID=459528 RepID=UPI001ABFDD82|nr:DUF6644 family protein [Pseudomonas duriflava]
MRQSSVAYLLVNAAHIASFGILLGSIVSLDLRLLGAFRKVPLATLEPFLTRIAACGVVLAFLSGFWLFTVNAQDYISNRAFLIKLGLIGLALLNVLLRHTAYRQTCLQEGKAVPRALQAHALLSLTCWLGVVLAGRWIGFISAI